PIDPASAGEPAALAIVGRKAGYSRGALVEDAIVRDAGEAQACLAMFIGPLHDREAAGQGRTLKRSCGANVGVELAAQHLVFRPEQRPERRRLAGKGDASVQWRSLSRDDTEPAL